MGSGTSKKDKSKSVLKEQSSINDHIIHDYMNVPVCEPDVIDDDVINLLCVFYKPLTYLTYNGEFYSGIVERRNMIEMINQFVFILNFNAKYLQEIVPMEIFKSQLEKLCKKENSSYALFIKAWCFNWEFGYKSNNGAMFELYMKCHELGNHLGSFGLGRYYEYGHHVEKNEITATEYYIEAMNNGIHLGTFRLGCLYMGKNNERAFKYLNAAINNGVLQAYVQKIILLRDDKYGIKDLKQVVETCREADAKNCFWATSELGHCYSKPVHVSKDYSITLECSLKTVELGHSYSFNKLGWLYENGYGVEKDSVKALFYYSKGAKYGNDNAKTNLERLKKDIDVEDLLDKVNFD